VAREIILEMKNISKDFPGVRALDDINFELTTGEIHALVGENGAGKSTLMSLLAGVHSDFRGTIKMNGRPVRFANPKEAIEHGVGIIYQELDLVPEFSVGENIFLADEPRAKNFRKIGLLSRKKIFSETARILSDLGFDIDPRARVGSLSTGEQQLVQIIKVIRLSAKVLIMDEPTARLAHDETKTLFKIMKVLKEKGVSIIYISHHMEEILQIADRISVLRDGKVVGTVVRAETSLSEIVQMVVGKKLSSGITRPEISKGPEEIFAVDGLALDGVFSDISFKIRSGEILGIGGLVGSGRSEIAHCIFGVEKLTGGEIRVGGQRVKIRSPLDAIKNNIILIPEERKAQGLILNHSVMSNLSLAYLRVISKYQFINGRKRQQSAQQMVNRLRIKTPSLNQEVGHLSGGNQQKVVLGKWLPLKPMVVILDQPTRGIDIGAKREIYDLIAEMAQNGSGIIIISDELPELIGLADRIMVVGKGRKTIEFNRGEVNQSQLLEAVVSHEKIRAIQH
jgi:ABC-type sugar transport system ATPase subunit